MIYCSIDPASTRNLGWAVVNYSSHIEEYLTGTIVLDDVEPRWRVLLSIYQNVLQLLSDHKPGLVILEQTSSFAGGFVTGQVSQCIGVILLVCLQNNIDVVFVYPTHVKATVVGKGKASKSQVKKSVTNVLYVAGFDAAVKFSSEHAADALANVFCYLSDAKMITLPEPLFKPVKRRKKNGK